MALPLANGVDDLVSCGVSLTDKFGIRAPVLQESAKHRGVVRRVGSGKMDVRRSHHLERVDSAGLGVCANSLQRVVQEPESIRSNPRDQRRFVIEMTVERGPRDADVSPDSSKRQPFHSLSRNNLDCGGDERTLKVAVVIPAFLGS